MATDLLLTMDEALAQLGVTSATLNAQEKRALDEQGYLVFRDVMDEPWLEQLRTAFEQACADQGQNGVEYGQQGLTRHMRDLLDRVGVFAEAVRRFGDRHISARDLLDRGGVFTGVCTHPKVLAAVYYILWRPFRVANVSGRDPLPGSGLQGLHVDWGLKRAPRSFEIVNTLWLLDDFTTSNGATRLVPGTHHRKKKVPKAWADPASRHPDEVVVEAPAGSVLIFNGHLWHGGTLNRGDGSRRILQCAFVAREHYQDASTPPADREAFSPALRYLLGA